MVSGDKLIAPFRRCAQQYVFSDRRYTLHRTYHLFCSSKRRRNTYLFHRVGHDRDRRSLNLVPQTEILWESIIPSRPVNFIGQTASFLPDLKIFEILYRHRTSTNLVQKFNGSNRSRVQKSALVTLNFEPFKPWTTYHRSVTDQVILFFPFWHPRSRLPRK